MTMIIIFVVQIGSIQVSKSGELRFDGRIKTQFVHHQRQSRRPQLHRRRRDFRHDADFVVVAFVVAFVVFVTITSGCSRGEGL